jgi:putative transposase
MISLFDFLHMRRRYELTDEQYNRLRPLLSGKPGDPGRNAEDNRRFLNAVLWSARTGAPWADPPERFGKYDTVYQRSGRRTKKGLWQSIFEALQEPDLDWVMLDSSAVRAHLCAAVRKKGSQRRGARAKPRRLLHKDPRRHGRAR